MMNCKLKMKAIFRTIKNCMSNKFSTLEKFCEKRLKEKEKDWKKMVVCGRVELRLFSVVLGLAKKFYMLQKNSNEFFRQPNICVLVLCYSFQLIYILFIFRKNKLFTIASQHFYESLIKKAECWRIDAFELWCWRRLLRIPWTARRSN